MFDDNPVVIDIHSRTRSTKKILCVICKVQLKEIEPRVWKCPKCKNQQYIFGYEILEHEDDFESSHENEDVELSGLESDSNVGLLAAINEDVYATTIEEEDENITTKSDIKIPKYMKDSETTKVIEYREE